MNHFMDEANIFVKKMLYITIFFVKLLGSIIIFMFIPILTIIGIEYGERYLNLSINNDLLKYVVTLLSGVIVGLIIKTKNTKKCYSDDDEQNQIQSKWRNRDWKWTIGILVAVIILLLTFWLGNNQEVGGYFSFGANSVSITLGLVAIFYAFNQSEASSRQNSILENTLNDINAKVLELSFIKKDLLQMDTNITAKYDELINITKKAENASKISGDNEQKQGDKEEYVRKLESIRKQVEKQKQKQLESLNRHLNVDYNLLNINNKVVKRNCRNEVLFESVAEYEVIFEVNDNFEPAEFLDNLCINLRDYTFNMYKREINTVADCGNNILKIWLYGKGKNNITLIKNYIYSCSNGINRNISVKKQSNLMVKKSKL